MSQDIQALNVLFSADSLGADTYVAISPVLKEIYDKISPDAPKNLVATEVESSIEETVYHYNYDEGHAGRFSVPNTSGGSVAFWDIFGKDNPPEYIANNLSFYPLTGTEVDQDNIIYFVPGLNTMHQSTPDGTSTVERLLHYAKVHNYPYSQLQLGTSLDQGNIVIPPEDAESLIPVLNKMIEDGSLPHDVRPVIKDGSIFWSATQIDRMQVMLSYPNTVDTPIKNSIRGLLESTKQPNAKPVTIFGYSRGALELEAALRHFIKHNDSEETIDRLRERVTVVTVGNGSKKYPDGPAYIHLSSYNDPLSRGRGVTAERPEGAGKDAVFLHCNTPYSPAAFDNHNYGAITSQYLSLMVAANNATSVRDLWNKAQAGDMVTPERIDEAINAMIRLTRGYEWLWNNEQAWEGIPDAEGSLPDDDQAKEILREVMGEKYLNIVLTNFGDN